MTPITNKLRSGSAYDQLTAAEQAKVARFNGACRSIRRSRQIRIRLAVVEPFFPACAESLYRFRLHCGQGVPLYGEWSYRTSYR